ncbi:hypothetical protein V1509DRAFT_624597, partial [Lipomyces kononenkoae]
MFDLVQHSSASFSTIASVLNSTYRLSLLARDVYNRTYDHARESKSSSARFIETLRDEGYIYTMKVTTDANMTRSLSTQLDEKSSSGLLWLKKIN